MLSWNAFMEGGEALKITIDTVLSAVSVLIGLVELFLYIYHRKNKN